MYQSDWYIILDTLAVVKVRDAGGGAFAAWASAAENRAKIPAHPSRASQRPGNGVRWRSAVAIRGQV